MGIPVQGLETVVLGLDELEAVRLADSEGLYQDEAAARMEVSRATYGRILGAGRAKIAEALIEGKLLLIGEAPVRVSHAQNGRCPVHGEEWRRGRWCRCGKKAAGEKTHEKPNAEKE